MNFRKFFLGKRKRATKMIPQAPAPDPNRGGIAIVAIMKNEASHIEDWLRFHSLAGVKAFFLYDDGSTDRTVELAKAFGGARVSILPWTLRTRFKSPDVSFDRQVLAYCHAIENFGSAFKWMAFIDIDEYLVPLRDNSLIDALNGLNDGNISLPWTMFGPSGHESPPALSSPYAYTFRARHRRGPLLNFKCIVDPCDVTEAHVHRFKTRSMGNVSSNDVGFRADNKLRSSHTFVSAECIQLNHYYTRSKHELYEKIEKGDPPDTDKLRRRDKILEKLSLIEDDQVVDTSAGDFLRRIGVFTNAEFCSTVL